ncbi:MAG: hypothetical protein HQL09_07545 [Nitrospirae bacterium]|nr:hypothetical protein [Nitrospirota bacterium]
MLTFFMLAIAVVGTSCATYQDVRTENASETEVTGTYSLVLYGGTGAQHLEAVAILSKEDAPYTIVPYAPDFEYRIIKHMPAAEALARAYVFIRLHPDVMRTQFTKIVDSSSGALLGYDIRPLYRASSEGYDDVFYIDYWKKGDKVFAKMHLIFQVERRVYGGGP